MSDLAPAIRALLAEPLIDRSDPVALALVRRHRAELTRWFADELGYRLDASRPGVARLAKLPGAGHVPRGLRTRTGHRSFDGRRYALVCLVLAAVEAAGERCTLARMFEEVATRAAGIEGLAFDSEVGADRRAFIQAVQAAVDLGVLDRAEGDEERFARGEQGGDALYRIDRARLALLPTATQPPSLVAEPGDLAAEAYPETEEGRARRRRHRVTRALVDEPVLYQDDLAADEREYIRSQRRRLEDLLHDKLGLTLEVRAEGWVAVDESGEMTDLAFPSYGTAEAAALRVCDEIRQRPGYDWDDVGLVAFVQGLADEYAGYWKKDAGAEAGAADLTVRAVGILLAARLVERTLSGIRARPAAGRFAAIATAPPISAPALSESEPA